MNDTDGIVDDLADASDRRDERTAAIIATAALALVAALAALDVVADLREGTTLRHLLLEGAVVGAGLAGAAWQGRRLQTLRRRDRALSVRAGELERDLAASRREAERWQRDARDLIAGLSAAIDAQLERWGLSPAEKETALLLLKGLSHKEIAAARAVGETTARQQARAIYKKSGLTGRADLAAFFLEDLLGPRPAAEAQPGPASSAHR